MQNPDITAESRKSDHITLAFQSRTVTTDSRFDYEPMLAPHPQKGVNEPFSFLGKTMNAPLWVSSMTGGTEKARIINHNLARACGEFGMGMGLGSCRQLLYSDEFFADFNIRPLMGDAVPMFANLGVAQLEHLLAKKEWHRVDTMIEKLRADGLIIHVNPLQEWLQPEGDRFERSPIDLIQEILTLAKYPIIVKEVGQGFGKKSIETLLRLPIAALDFAAAGGTNFAKLELLRSSPEQQAIFEALALVGHTATEMVEMTNEILQKVPKSEIRCSQIIVSGGIRHFLDGYYCMEKLQLPSIYGQASGFLEHAQGSYEQLQSYVTAQIEGLAVAKAFLRVR